MPFYIKKKTGLVLMWSTKYKKELDFRYVCFMVSLFIVLFGFKTMKS